MTNTSPLISIIIPVYKVEPYLRQCLDSVLAQTYPHWEAICINDGSPDNCGAILDEYAAKDSRFIVIHQENQGVSVARNRGLEVMQGKYLTLLDADDWFSPGALECIITAMEESTADFGRCSRTDHEPNGETKRVLRGASFYHENVPYTSHILCVLDRKNIATEAGGAVFICDKIRSQNLKFIPHAKLSEDIDFVVHYLSNTTNVVYIFSPIYHYRKGIGAVQGFISNSVKYSIECVDAMINILERLQDLKPSRHFSRTQKHGFYAILLQCIFAHSKILTNIANTQHLNLSNIKSPKKIFRIIINSNIIDSLKLILRFYCPLLNKFKRKFLN
ncbi:MAG: glycosyltransferase [Akkermansia sp.]|nr:glycosyltransferase [Akkermansia sp.]